HEEGCTRVAHGAASKGNDQVRMETAIAAQDPRLEVLAPVRQWNLHTLVEKLTYARRRRLPVEDLKAPQGILVDRNLWGTSFSVNDLPAAWTDPPASIYTMTVAPENTPDQP